MEGSTRKGPRNCRPNAAFLSCPQCSSRTAPNKETRTTIRHRRKRYCSPWKASGLHSFGPRSAQVGTVSGVDRALRELHPNARLHRGRARVVRHDFARRRGPSKIQGIAAGFVPRNYGRSRRCTKCAR